MDVINDMYEHVGQRITFKTTDGEYEGIVSHVNQKFSRIKINRAVLLPERKFMGTLFFYDYEIQSYALLSSKETNETELDNLYTATLNRYKKSAKKYTTSHVYYSDSECASHSVDDGESIEKSEEKYVFVPPEKFQSLLPTDLIILEDVDSEFVKIIDYIKKELVIGVTFEGPKVKRNGILSWICISTPLHTFLFDMKSLKSACFDKGLRSILEDPNIEKVIHDCRKPADCLFNMFKTKLVNVFDTQVADYMIRYQKIGNDKKFTRNLNSCLAEYLNVPKIFLLEQPVYNSFQSLVNSFNIRPIGDKIKDFIMKNVVYLLMLKKELSVLLMESFHNAVTIYSSSVSSCSEMELLLEPSTSDKIPFQLMIERLNMLRLKRKGSDPVVVSTGYQYQAHSLLSSTFSKLGVQPSSVLKQIAASKQPPMLLSNVKCQLVEKIITEKHAEASEERKPAVDMNNSDSDDDPWKKLRDEFLPYCDLNYKKNFQIVPA